MGREREPRFVVPPNFGRSSGPPLSPSVAGRGPHPSPGPLLALSSSVPFRGVLSAGGPVSVRGKRNTHAPSSRFLPFDIIPNGHKSQRAGGSFPPAGGFLWKNRPRYAVKGLVLGLTISLQSGSPRAPRNAAHCAGTPRFYLRPPEMNSAGLRRHLPPPGCAGSGAGTQNPGVTR